MPRASSYEARRVSLSRQLLVGIVAMFIALLLGIEVVYVRHARESLAKQLDAHANETATSLALAIGSRLPTLDPVMVNVMVNPVFDRGHFESIQIIGTDGKMAFERRLDRYSDEAPSWFVELVALDPPQGESLITAKWRQLGKVVVRVYPQFAYAQLWETALATLQFLSLLFIAALAGMHFYLRGILKPLRQIENAATAISNLEFVSITEEPSTRELRRVTRAINSLSEKVRGAITEETERAERLRKDAFEDPLTGGLNRRGFESAMTALLADRSEVASGALALFKLEGLVAVNQLLGQDKGNEMLRHLAGTMAGPTAPKGTITGRWLGPTLAAFLPNVTPDAGCSWAGDVCKRYEGELLASRLPGEVAIVAGLVTFGPADADLQALGGTGEHALGGTAGRSSGTVVAEALGSPGTGGASLQDIESALAGDRIVLVFQRVLSIPVGDVLHAELFSQLARPDGRPIAAGTFIPMASQYGLLPTLDRKVISLALASLGANPGLPRTISVNLSVQSLLDGAFRDWLRQTLKANGPAARRLTFELTGGAASRSAQAAREFSLELRRLGSRLALDNFEVDRNSIALVHELRLAYVKLAPVFTREIGSREDVRFIVEAVLRAFRPLEVPIIAQGVEDETLLPVLAEIGIAGYQGYIAGRPEPLAPPAGAPPANGPG